MRMAICYEHMFVTHQGRVQQAFSMWDPLWHMSSVRSYTLPRDLLSGHLASDSSQVALVPSRQSRILESPENPSFLLGRHPQQHAPWYQLMCPPWLLQWARCLAKLRGEKAREANWLIFLIRTTQYPPGPTYPCEDQGWRFPWTNTSQPEMLKPLSLWSPGALRRPGVLRDDWELCPCWFGSLYVWRLQCDAEAAIWQYASYHFQGISALETIGALSCLSSSSIFCLKHSWVLGLRKQRELSTRDSTGGARFPPQTLAATFWPHQPEAITVPVPVDVAPRALSNLAWPSWAGSVLVTPLFLGESVTFSRMPSSCSARGPRGFPSGDHPPGFHLHLVW